MARERYSSGARLYDALSAEWPVYRIGRTTAIERRGLRTVRLLESDATALDVDAAREALGGPADVVLATYTLSIMSDPAEAWRRALAVARPGARVAIVDMQEPRGSARLVAPIARAFAGFGGADLDVRPWRMIEAGARGVSARGLRGGHIQVRVGTVPETAPSSEESAA